MANLKSLTTAQAQQLLQEHGPNEIKTKSEFTALKIFFGQFTSVLVFILILAGVVSIALKETVDGIAILAIVVVNAIIGFIQEYKAENAVKALKKLVVPTTLVIRDGKQQEIDVRQIVPGDLVILEEGEKIPADLEILESFSLKVDESMLTGESMAVEKPVGEKGFKGTLVTSGRAKAKVLSTGMNTEFGKIVNLLSENKKSKSPLTIQLDTLGKKIALITFILVVILFILGYFRGIEIFEMLMTSVALGVSAIPEGMPIIVTLTLAMGVQILARKNAIVRKMNAIETLGATTIICSDKTGTLTLNEMTAHKVYTSAGEQEIPGSGYSLIDRVEFKSFEEIKLLEICENCNNSVVEVEENLENPNSKNTSGSKFPENPKVLGDPTEIALKILVRKNYAPSEVPTYETVDENVFTSERKMMSTLNLVTSKDSDSSKNKKHNSEKIVFAKGAFEEILKKSKFIQKGEKIEELTEEEKEKITAKAISYSEEALRVLAFAYKKYEESETPETDKSKKDKNSKETKENLNFAEDKLIFVGLIGLLDPPRKSVAHSIKLAQEAGIQVKIITGDNAITAKAIGEKIGLKGIVKEFSQSSENLDQKNSKDPSNSQEIHLATGAEIDKLSDEELTKLLKTTTIFARTKPEHKFRLVDLLKKQKEIVAVTGDGVNDAPALKHANVGVAMGIKGTEATKEVADIVLKDDNFSTIVKTIEEGRRIYHNLLSFIKYMLSANFITIFVVGIITVLGMPLPILPLQVLWINIATDSLPALALGRSPASGDLMKEKPHPKSEKLFNKFFTFILSALILQILVNLGVYFYGQYLDNINGISTSNLGIVSHTRTLVFTQTVMFELFFALVCKDEKLSSIKKLLSNRSLVGAILISLLLQFFVIYTPFMQTIFKTTALGWNEWLIVILGASTAFLVPSVNEWIKKIKISKKSKIQTQN